MAGVPEAGGDLLRQPVVGLLVAPALLLYVVGANTRYAVAPLLPDVAD